MRAARTDKGVSAVGQCISLRVQIEPAATLIERINSHAPPGFEFFGYTRVTSGGACQTLLATSLQAI